MSAEIVTCPKCGAPIDFPSGNDKTTCFYCKSIVTKSVARGSTLQRIQETKEYVERGWNSILSSQQSLKFFNMAIELDPDNGKAWVGKGNALLGSIGALRMDFFTGKFTVGEVSEDHRNVAEEALRCVQKGIEVSGELSSDILEGNALDIRYKLALRLGKWEDIFKKGLYKSGY